MKPILYIALAGSFALGACSSTYKTAQTPDDVYYSPRQQQRTYASNNGSNGNSVQDENGRYTDAPDDGGTYVTYDDDQGDYQRRINRFGSNAGTYNGGYWDGYNAASNMYMGSGFGYGYGPYSSFGYSSLWGPSMSMGFGWGYGGFYRPWSYGLGMGWGGYPYIGSYWPYYGGGYYGHYPYYAGGYYGGGYYGGGHYGGGYYTRPANSYGPVRNNNERISRSNYTNNSGGNSGGGGYYRPSRGATAPVNGGGNGNYVPSNTDRPRRVFQQSSSERPVISRPSYDNGGGNYNNNGGNYSRPSRVEYSRPSAPSPAPSYSAPSGGGRSNSGGGGGGGGYTRPSRGGR
ncbi:hypothetical protein HHL17_12100 [Chitinophaga sp. G-6-1-13]|uniref:Uncharacterized protein n=1 Tax=Chitinophaga fulva TaxID=2728842 RepID=A0A848GJ83_9BACT|nr:hypothetical protein [Chitinophaga fulva]NML37937.1 hypothetical protein [Chitinophaga fulva]